MERQNLCPVCSGTGTTPTISISRYTLYRCQTCTAVFLTPRPQMSQAIENNLDVYDAQKTLQTFAAMADKMMARARRQIKIVESLEKRGNKRKVLDVGCSYGYALKVFQEAGYEPYGIDISPASTRFVREHHGIPAETCSFESFAPKKRFDVITMFDVIEHMVDPRAAIKKAYDLLKPGGILLIQTPNFDSLIRKLTGKRWYWLLVPWHLTLFTPGSMRRLLEKRPTPPTLLPAQAGLFGKEEENNFDLVRLATWDDMYEVGSNILDIVGLKREGRFKKWHRRMAKIVEMTGPVSHCWNMWKFGGELEVYAIKQ